MLPKKLGGFVDYDDGDKVCLSLRFTLDRSSIFFEAESIEMSAEDSGRKDRWYTKGKLKRNSNNSYQSTERHRWKREGSRGGPEGYLTIDEIEEIDCGSTYKIWGAFTEYDLEDHSLARYSFSGALDVVEEFSLKSSAGSDEGQPGSVVNNPKSKVEKALTEIYVDNPRSAAKLPRQERTEFEINNETKPEFVEIRRDAKFSQPLPDIARRWSYKKKIQQAKKLLIFTLRLGFVAAVYVLIVKGCNAPFE